MAENKRQIFEANDVIEIAKEDGSILRFFPITKVGNIIGLKEFIESSDKYNDALLLLAYNPYVIDDVTDEVYKIGVANGKLYWTKADDSLRNILKKDEPEQPDTDENEPNPES